MSIEAVMVVAMFVTLVVLLFTGYPVAYVLGGVAMIFGVVAIIHPAYNLNFIKLSTAVENIHRLSISPNLLALPMFIFMGVMLEQSGVAERMMVAMQKLFGRLRGGLALTVTLIGVLLAASTGIIGASVVLLGMMSLPVMLKQGYSKTLATGVVCSAGSLGILIPPSIMLVIMADNLGVSVGDLFLGAVFPGLVLAAFYVTYIIVLGLIKPSMAPISDDYEPLRPAIFVELFWSIVPPAVLIVLVLGSILRGYATPTEASGVGAMGATIIALANRKLSSGVFQQIVMASLKTTAFITTILIGAKFFSQVLRQVGGDEVIARAFGGLNLDRYAMLAVLILIVFLLGFVLDWIEITLIALPLFKPVVLALGFEINGFGLDNAVLVWFALLVAIALQTSFLSPPVGFALFYLKGVCPPEVKLTDIYKGVIPFIILQLATLLVVIKWPELVTWLPSVKYGH